MESEKIKVLAAAFDLKGDFISAKEFGDGHINDTILLTYRDGEKTNSYVLQKVNRSVFKDSEGLMDNMVLVTDYIRQTVIKKNGDPMREVLTIVPAKDGTNYTLDEENSLWRVTLLVPEVYSRSVVENAEMLRETGRAFGKFLADLDGFDASLLKETIPNFHHTLKRFEAFKKALAADKLNRVKDCRKEIDFVLGQENFVSALTERLEKGELPLRVTHNDTKINNVLLDKATGKAICVCDLDTVMPGLVAYDFGDSIRSGTNPADEDERDLSLVTMRLDLYEAYTEGYLETAGKIITPAERKSLPVGARMMTLECGIRFLTDHLDGDNYFKIARENHNLDRARTQFKMVEDMDKVWDQMVAIAAR